MPVSGHHEGDTNPGGCGAFYASRKTKKSLSAFLLGQRVALASFGTSPLPSKCRTSLCRGIGVPVWTSVSWLIWQCVSLISRVMPQWSKQIKICGFFVMGFLASTTVFSFYSIFFFYKTIFLFYMPAPVPPSSLPPLLPLLPPSTHNAPSTPQRG